MKVELSDYDRSLLAGDHGEAKRKAMGIIVRMAELQGAGRLIDISRAHIDGCAYNGEASILFPAEMAKDGDQVSVPTTMNAISVDRRQPDKFDIDKDFADKANQVVDAYEKMGVKATYACTPYQLPDAPIFGEHIAWAESNAVVFANSVLGARSNRYGDFMDLCAALTGRAPLSGYHLDEARLGTILVRLPELASVDASFYPILGYLIGKKVGKGVPVIEGLNHSPTHDELKSFGAALATSGAVGMFHIVGVTPEAESASHAFGHREPGEIWDITIQELKETWEKLTIDGKAKTDLVLLGSPQFSLDEFKTFAESVEGERCHEDAKLFITTNRFAYEQAEALGLISILEQFGANIITDSCLCMIRPFIEKYMQNNEGVIMTNSGKFVHYGPGLTGQEKIFIGSLDDCVQSAISGHSSLTPPAWLNQE